MRAVGQFDEDDAHIARHGEQHFSKRLGLVFFAGVELQLVQLGQSVYQFGHWRAKAVDQVGFGDAAIFHGVMEQCGHQGLCIQLPGGALGGHCDGVGDVGLAAVAQLTQMGLVCKAVGLTHLLNAGGVEVVQVFCQRSKAGRSCVGGGGSLVGGELALARSGLRCRS